MAKSIRPWSAFLVLMRFQITRSGDQPGRGDPQERRPKIDSMENRNKADSYR